MSTGLISKMIEIGMFVSPYELFTNGVGEKFSLSKANF